MRCSCRVCGTYMVQTEKGLSSGCKCPNCFNECHDCMGSTQGPMSVEQLAMLRFTEAENGEPGSNDEQEGMKDWRKNL